MPPTGRKGALALRGGSEEGPGGSRKHDWTLKTLICHARDPEQPVVDNHVIECG